MYTVLENGRIANENGEIAIRYKPDIPKYLQVGKSEYVFTVNNHVSLIWVKPDEVDRILNMKKECCGGNTTFPCQIASEVAVKFWLGLLP